MGGRKIKMMYKKNRLYKFETTSPIYYTGKVVNENNLNIKIETIRDETIILNKNEIVRSLLLE